MTRSETMAKLLEISENSYFRWKKKDHVKLINLIEKYFTLEQLQEFIDTNRILSFENKDYIQTYFRNNNKMKYLEYFKDFNLSLKKSKLDLELIEFYFNFLIDFKNNKDFNKKLNKFVLNKQMNDVIQDIINNLPVKTLNVKNTSEDLKQKTVDNSINTFDYIHNNLHFINDWDQDMNLFIYFLIQNDFELFLNSDNGELLYHAIYFLYFKYDNACIHDNINEIETIYNLIFQNKELRKSSIIKNLFKYKSNFKRLSEYENVKNCIMKISYIYTNKLNGKDLYYIEDEDICYFILDDYLFDTTNKILYEFDKIKFNIDLFDDDTKNILDIKNIIQKIVDYIMQSKMFSMGKRIVQEVIEENQN